VKTRPGAQLAPTIGDFLTTPRLLKVYTLLINLSTVDVATWWHAGDVY
jgi:hypothetical protein